MRTDEEKVESEKVVVARDSVGVLTVARHVTRDVLKNLCQILARKVPRPTD